MSEFEWNPNAAKEIEKEVKEVVEESITEVAQTHSGKPKSEVRSALIAATKRRGLKFEPDDEIVSLISSDR